MALRSVPGLAYGRVGLLLCSTELHYSTRRRRRRYVPPTGPPAPARTLTPIVHSLYLVSIVTSIHPFIRS